MASDFIDSGGKGVHRSRFNWLARGDMLESSIDQGFPKRRGQQFLKVQLKGRLTLDQQYQGTDIWVCFRHHDVWYLYPHDAALTWALENKSLGKNANVWKNGTGVWSYPSPPKDFLKWLAPYALTNRSTGPAQIAAQAG